MKAKSLSGKIKVKSEKQLKKPTDLSNQLAFLRLNKNLF
jgi:hypothetical protein